MKKLFLSLFLLACVAMFNACSTDVELYADYKDIPVVYGLIDATQDTNFVRINRAFSSSNDNPINANEVALIADSCNYPGKLKAYLLEYKKNPNTYGSVYVSTGRAPIFLDTMTIRNKETGIFYAPIQKVYYTTEIFKENTASALYRYRLEIIKENDTVSAETGVVGGAEFKITNGTVAFSSAQNDNTSKISFKPADNAVFYSVKMVFHYREKHGDVEETKQVQWDFGTKSTDEIGYEEHNGVRTYYITYGMNSLFQLLADAIGGDTVVNPNHPQVQRYFDEKPVDIMIAAGGDELYNYIQVNSVSGYSQTVPDYTNVKGGYGVFSSRVNLIKTVGISSRAQIDLYAKPWGFVQQ
jgi:hypothetical protein